MSSQMGYIATNVAVHTRRQKKYIVVIKCELTLTTLFRENSFAISQTADLLIDGLVFVFSGRGGEVLHLHTTGVDRFVRR